MDEPPAAPQAVPDEALPPSCTCPSVHEDEWAHVIVAKLQQCWWSDCRHRWHIHIHIYIHMFKMCCNVLYIYICMSVLYIVYVIYVYGYM